MKITVDDYEAFFTVVYDRKTGKLAQPNNCIAFDDALGYGIFYDYSDKGGFVHDGEEYLTHVEWHDWEIVIKYDEIENAKVVIYER